MAFQLNPDSNRVPTAGTYTQNEFNDKAEKPTRLLTTLNDFTYEVNDAASTTGNVEQAGTKGADSGSKYSDNSYRSSIVGMSNIASTLNTYAKGCGNTSQTTTASSTTNDTTWKTWTTKYLPPANLEQGIISMSQPVTKPQFSEEGTHAKSYTELARQSHMPTKQNAGAGKATLHKGKQQKKSSGYSKPNYAVVIGDKVRVCNTAEHTQYPQSGKYLVKQRVTNIYGHATMKLVLKGFNSQEKEKSVTTAMNQGSVHQTSGYMKPVFYRQNLNNPGRIIYTQDANFSGEFKYPIPSGNTLKLRIGDGGNGFVSVIYHAGKQYAVKKTVYRSNEINVHTALQKNNNILPLLAVLMGDEHERRRGKFYCFHFMPKLDFDLRQVLSDKKVGCLKYFYRNCRKDHEKFKQAIKNVLFTLNETLKALKYIHHNGYVHRDVKASNIMLKMNCSCSPIACDCASKFSVKLGDFDSAGTLPGGNIQDPTGYLIKYASVLPLGTPGYRAPEVSMHIVLSGPYETLYTAAVDMWSFGCLLLNICIGKTAAIKQREEAALLLSQTHICGQELWLKTSKISELYKAEPFSDMIELLKLVSACLQVNYKNRPSAEKASESMNKIITGL